MPRRIALLACLLTHGATAASISCIDSYGQISDVTHGCPVLHPLEMVRHANPAAIRNIVAHLTPVQVHAIVSPMSASEITTVLREASQAQIDVVVKHASHGQIRAVASAVRPSTLLSALNALGVEGTADLAAKVWPLIPIGQLTEGVRAHGSDRLSSLSSSELLSLVDDHPWIDRALKHISSY